MRPIPQNWRLERRVIACLFLAPTTGERRRMASHLTADDFTDPVCRFYFTHLATNRPQREMLRAMQDSYPDDMTPEGFEAQTMLMMIDRAGKHDYVYEARDRYIAKLQKVTVMRKTIVHLEHEIAKLYERNGELD